VLIFTEPSRSGVVLVPQVSHAWLAWQIAQHWGNRRFLRPAPRAETLAAVLLHDSGWTGHDADPSCDDNGKIRAFDAMPLDIHLAIWEASVSRAALTSRYAGLLVAAHHRLLAARKAAAMAGSDDAGMAPLTAFVTAMERREARWIEALRVDERAGAFVNGRQRRANQEILAACDQVSVYLCAALGGPFTLSGVAPTGADIPIRVEPTGPRSWRLSPWPLEGARLKVHCEGWAVPAAVFPDRDAARDALASAPTVRLTFTLTRPSNPPRG